MNGRFNRNQGIFSIQNHITNVWCDKIKVFTDRFNLNTKLLWPNFRFKDACTSRPKTSLRLCQGRVCVSCHWTLQCLCRGCFRVPFEDVSTSQSGMFQRLNYVMNRTYSLSYLHLLVRSSWKDAFTSGTHLRLGPDCLDVFLLSVCD